MAYNAIDIAKKIICCTDVEHGDAVTNLKLQKLLYYMQGFHLAFFGAPLFNEAIEAWTYGPVVPVVFQEFRKYKKRAINPDNYHDGLVLSDEQQRMFDMVYSEYNRFSAVTLMKMTHTEGPWKNHDIGDVIPNEELRAFFLTQIDCEKSINTDGYGRIVLADAMRESLANAQESLVEDQCLTEEMFETRFAKWPEERRSLPEQDLIPEELLGAAWKEIDQVYQQKDLADDGETIDLETFRADLHRMIEGVYARP